MIRPGVCLVGFLESINAITGSQGLDLPWERPPLWLWDFFYTETEVKKNLTL